MKKFTRKKKHKSQIINIYHILFFAVFIWLPVEHTVLYSVKFCIGLWRRDNMATERLYIHIKPNHGPHLVKRTCFLFLFFYEYLKGTLKIIRKTPHTSSLSHIGEERHGILVIRKVPLNGLSDIFGLTCKIIQMHGAILRCLTDMWVLFFFYICSKTSSYKLVWL